MKISDLLLRLLCYDVEKNNANCKASAEKKTVSWAVRQEQGKFISGKRESLALKENYCPPLLMPVR